MKNYMYTQSRDISCLFSCCCFLPHEDLIPLCCHRIHRIVALFFSHDLIIYTLFSKVSNITVFWQAGVPCPFCLFEP